MADESVDGTRYRAFLSYSHKDSAAARALHRRIESFSMPRRLVGTPGHGGPVPARLTPIFRDRDELPAAGDLSETVRAALAASQSLVVLCSPNAAASQWVEREIALFRKLHPGRPILAAVIAGEPDRSFPPGLRLGPGGETVEPLAADLRREGDGPRLGLLKLVAGLTGVPLDALVQRDAQRRVRRVTAVTAAALAAVLAMAVLTAFALNARSEAERQRAEAEGLVEFMLTDLRDRLKGVGRLDVLTAVNQRALDHYQRQDLDDLPPDALERRARILHAMGEDDMKLGHSDRALAQFREAARATSALLARDPANPARIYAHAQSEYWVGSIDEQRGDFAAAGEAYRRYRDQVVRLNALVPNNPKYVGELGFAESNIGTVLLKGLKQPGAARAAYEHSLAWFRAASHLEPGRQEWTVEAADAYAWIADTYFEEKRLDEARRARLKEQELKEALLASDPQNAAHRYALVIARRSLARIDIEKKDHARARTILEEARRDMEALRRTDPSNEIWRDQAARIEADRAQLFAAIGSRTQAEEALAAARTLLLFGRKSEAELTAAQQKILARIFKISSEISHAPAQTRGRIST